MYLVMVPHQWHERKDVFATFLIMGLLSVR